MSGALKVFGGATITDDGVCLTAGPSQTSAVFIDTPIPQTTSFRCTLDYRLHAPEGSGAADGIAVVFAPEMKLGLSGYGLGYSGLGGQGDFAVEGAYAKPRRKRC